MSDLASTLDPEELLAHTRWLRRLARGLVADEAAADDLVQETVLAATERAPADRPLGPWLVRVMRNLARMRWRSDGRRAVRESRAHEAVDAPSTPEELLARVEMQRRLVRLVVDLAEPYRAVVLLHYVEGLSSREIADQLGIAAGTVRWRLKEALDRLRARLDEDAGGRRAVWLAPLVEIAGDDRTAAAGATAGGALLGGMVVKKKVAGVSLLLIALLLGGLWWSRSTADRASDPEEPSALAISARGSGPTRAEASDPLPDWLVQEGAQPRRIAGRVVRDGAPVEGAVVRLHPGHGFSVPPAVLDQRITASDGRFDFGSRAPSVYFVAATAADASPVVARVQLADPRDRPPSAELVLELGACVARLTGQVVDVAGPVAGAEVRVADAELDGGARLTVAGVSTDDGRFSVCLPPGSGRLRIDADGYAAAQLTFGHDGAYERDIMLVPEAMLSGVAVDERGEPIAGARVLATPLIPQSPRYLSELAPRSAIAGSDGRFEIGGLGPGPYELMAAHRGSAGRYPTPLVLAAGESREIVVELAPTAVVRGRVVSSGSPVGGVTVRISEFTPNSVEPVISQSDGSFTMRSVPRGRLLLEVSDHELIRPRELDVDAAEVDVELEVEPRATIQGRVTSLGRGVSGARVYVAQGRRDPVIADRHGDYVISGVVPGQTGVWAASPEIDAVAAFRPVTVAAGETATVEIELEHTASVSGRVTDPAGHPVPSVYLRLRMDDPADDGYCTTDEQGGFRCPGLRGGGSYRVYVHPSPAATGALPLARGSISEVAVPSSDSRITDVQIAIEPELRSITGQVVDADGIPVPDAYVVVSDGGQRPMPGAAPPETSYADVRGRFELRGLAPGRYTLRARAPAGEAVVPDVVAGARSVRISLQSFGSIDGSLAGFDRGVRVSARSRDLATHGIVWGQVAGSSFRFDDLPPGDYYVTAQQGADGARLDAAAATVRAGTTTRVSLTNRRTATITGLVRELGTAIPVPGLFCNATVAVDGVRANNGVLGDPSDPGRTTDPDGRFTIAPAPAGDDIRVECWSHDVALSHAAINRSVAAGATGAFELRVVRRRAGDLDVGLELDPWTVPALVREVRAGSATARAGLKPNDQVVEVAGHPTIDLAPDGVVALLQNCVRAGGCPVVVHRGGSPARLQLRP